MAGLAHDARESLPAVPGSKKVTADAYGFIALTPEGMAGTSQDLPAAETAVMAVAQGSIAARCFDEKLSGAAWAFKPLCIMATHDRMIAPPLSTRWPRRMGTRLVRCWAQMRSARCPLFVAIRGEADVAAHPPRVVLLCQKSICDNQCHHARENQQCREGFSGHWPRRMACNR